MGKLRTLIERGGQEEEKRKEKLPITTDSRSICRNMLYMTYSTNTQRTE